MGGTFGAVSFGYIGFLIGDSIPFEVITGQILIVIVFAVVGYSLMYFINVVPAFMLVFTVLVALGNTAGMTPLILNLLVAAAIAIVTTVLYSKHKMVMCDLYGGVLILLCLVGYAAPAISIVLAIIITAGGVPIQGILKRLEASHDIKN